jgi:hypothetical protein
MVDSKATRMSGSVPVARLQGMEMVDFS